MTTIYLVRHGAVDNPQGIIYGRLPGYGLSQAGRADVEAAAQALAAAAPFDALYTSPLQRAQESAAILARRLGLEPRLEARIEETDVSGYQGRPFADLPSPYLTEEGVPGIEGAASMRARMLAFVADAGRDTGRDVRRHARVVAVSHRDPIAVLLLAWMGFDLSRSGQLSIPTGSVHEVQLDGERVAIRGPAAA